MRERVRRGLRAVALTLIAALLLPVSSYAAEQQPAQPRSVNPAVAGFDVVIVRPLGLAALAVGAVFFVPAALLTVANGKDSLRGALEVFVTDPVKNVFQRPLGEF